MILEIWLSDNLPRDENSHLQFKAFLQAMANRRSVGSLQYEKEFGYKPDRRRRYMTRLAKELEAYHQSGNFEHLLNIATYAYLESVAPENPKLHWDPEAVSVTRGKI